MRVTKAQQIDAVLSTIQGRRPQKCLLAHCIDGKTLESLATNYNNPQTIILVLNDNDLPILESVRSTVETWNTALKLYNQNSDLERLGLPSIPSMIYIGVRESERIASVYDALDKYLSYQGQLDELLGKAEISSGKNLKYHGPLPSQSLDLMPLMVHAQDLRLIGGTAGSKVIAELEQRKLAGGLQRLNFVLPWSSLNSARPNATHPEIFVDATQFYVVPAPKDAECFAKFESYAPSLIRDAQRALAGLSEPPFNLRNYKGPLTLF